MATRSRSKQRRSSRVATDADAIAAAAAAAANAASEEKAAMDDNDASIDHTSDNLDDNDSSLNPSAVDSSDDNGIISNNPNKLEQVWDNVQSSLTDNLLPFLGPEELLTTLLLNNTTAPGGDDDDDDVDSDQQQQQQKQQAAKQRLLTTSQNLFRYIEHLAQMEESLKEMQKLKKMKDFENSDDEEKEDDNEEEGEDDEVHQPCTLSGIPSLYTGQDEDSGEEKEEVEPVPVDAETIWGQVDLQNNALLPRLKKLIKKLAKRTNNAAGGADVEDDLVRVLDTGAMMMGSDDDDDDDDGSDEEEDGGDDFSEGSAASNFDQDEEDEDEEHDSDEDSEALRIRKRMEKTMADMSEDDNQSDEDEEDSKEQKLKQLAAQAASLESTLIDPTREEMRDGFFDLHEMEAFADEEEEMLPDDAYGMEDTAQDDGKKKEIKKKVLPHLKDRMIGDDLDEEDDEGDDDDDDDDDDEEEDGDDPLSKRFQPTTIRRKKYRADDEVDALYQLYDNENESDEESEDEEGGASALTAADFFGNPDKKLIKKYKAKRGKKVAKGKDSTKISSDDMKKVAAKKKAVNGDDDADSWDNHDFEEDGMDWKETGDKDKGGDEDNSEKDGGNEEENEEDEDETNEEEMNDIVASIKKSSSKHESQSQKLKEQTLQLEKDLMAEKPWKMMGEAKGTDRTKDSLLDSTPEFEVAFKPPPILTAEHTASIDDMIKKRILDEDWDDVVPRELPDIGIKRGGDAPEVSQEKSKLGLGELYEREYLKKATGFDRDAHEKQTEEDAAKGEMKDLFAHLCSQLDALSNYHFAPRPVAEEADVQNKSEDVPAIAMEEVLPLHVSGSRGKAPEEVYGGGGKGKASVLKGESELDQAERKRLRSSKKAARRKERQQKHADEKLISKLQPGLGLNNPYEKRKLREELQMARASGKVVVASDNKAEWEDKAAAGKEYRTSTKFFQKMQENVDTLVHGEDDDGRSKKKRKGVGEGQSSSVYKL